MKTIQKVKRILKTIDEGMGGTGWEVVVDLPRKKYKEVTAYIDKAGGIYDIIRDSGDMVTLSVLFGRNIDATKFISKFRSDFASHTINMI